MSGNYHEVNFRDKAIVAWAIEALRRKGELGKENFAGIPFDILRVQG